MTYKQQFIKFMVENGVLKFGEFTLKSGRKAPYFINTGNYKSGSQLLKLGEYYAACIAENGIKADALVGPAYKGIPRFMPTTELTSITVLTGRKLKTTERAVCLSVNSSLTEKESLLLRM